MCIYLAIWVSVRSLITLALHGVVYFFHCQLGAITNNHIDIVS